MSDELASILRSIQNTQHNIMRRLDALEAREKATAAHDWGTPFTSYGYVTPTDPPSTSVIVRGGWIWVYRYYDNDIDDVVPMNWPTTTVDLTNYANAFSNAYYYRWAVLAQELRVNAFDLWEYSSGTYEEELENPEVATRHFQRFLDGDIDLVDLWVDPVVFPHAVILLRNNGTTGSPGEILPVTLHDRDQSSILQWDARPWMSIVSSRV